MTRRDLLLAVALLARSSPGVAQPPPANARVGWLAHVDTMPRHFFDDALARLGWVEGKNLVIERRFGGSTGEQIASAAAELVAWRPDVIVALGTIDARPVLAEMPREKDLLDTVKGEDEDDFSAYISEEDEAAE